MNASEAINALNLRLIEDFRYEDLKRASKDPAYQEQLLKEYQI